MDNGEKLTFFLIPSCLLGASQRSKKNCSGLAKPVRSTNVSLRRDLIGSETLPLPIYKNEMLPAYSFFGMEIK
jgi:hypothetical protein